MRDYALKGACYSMDQDLETLNNLKVGIIGCGHLGQAIAHSLVSEGLEKSNLLLSYGGNLLTYQKLESSALASCVATNKIVFEQAGIVLITIKPKDIFTIKEIALRGNGLVVSCMAGMPINLINGILETNVHRMMFSGPDTIVDKIGVAAMYPEHEHLGMLLRVMNLTDIKLMAEDDMDIFTGRRLHARGNIGR